MGSTGSHLAPQVGFEPTTLRLTAGCSTAELLRNNEVLISFRLRFLRFTESFPGRCPRGFFWALNLPKTCRELSERDTLSGFPEGKSFREWYAATT